MGAQGLLAGRLLQEQADTVIWRQSAGLREPPQPCGAQCCVKRLGVHVCMCVYTYGMRICAHTYLGARGVLLKLKVCLAAVFAHIAGR